MSDENRKRYGDSKYLPIMDNLLYLKSSGVLGDEIFRLLWQSPELTEGIAVEYADMVLQEHTMADIDDKIRVCVETLKNGGKLSLSRADEISKLEGVTIKGESNHKFFVFDEIDNANGALFGLEFQMRKEASLIDVDPTDLLPDSDTFIFPKDYEQMCCVHALHDEKQFIERFAEEYKAGKAITANLRNEYEDFLKRMNAVFRITLYSRVKRIFKTPKLWECKAIEEDVEIRLDNISDDAKTQTQAALCEFVQTYTVKSGQILQIAVDGNMSAYRYTFDGDKSDFTPLNEFYRMPVDPDKIWAVLTRFRLVSSYAENLPAEIAAELSDEEQFYAKRMIAWQAEAGTERAIVAKTATLAERIKYIQDNNILAAAKNTKELGRIGKKPTPKIDG
jgi:hypothetical protein